MKIYTNLTARQAKFKGEINLKDSETIPDQAVSPQELLRRYATGQPLGFKNATPVYDEDENFSIPELYKMDKLDRLHALQNSSEDLIEKQSDFKQQVHKFQQKQKESKKIAPQPIDNQTAELSAKKSEAPK